MRRIIICSIALACIHFFVMELDECIDRIWDIAIPLVVLVIAYVLIRAILDELGVGFGAGFWIGRRKTG